jgi:Tfp pilus assembly protein PilE
MTIVCKTCGCAYQGVTESNVVLRQQRDQARADLAAAKQALEDLLDVQNGPPLLRDKEAWEAAMAKAQAIVDGK